MIARPSEPRFAGYVQAGGGSTRFGRDKALVELAGAPMLARMIRLLQSVCSNVKIVAPSGKYTGYEAETVADQWPGGGPLGGIITALEATAAGPQPCDWNLVVSCDMPFLTVDWLRFLLQRAESSAGDVVLARSASGPEPLCACWRTAAAGILVPAFERGVRKVMDGVKQLKAEVLDEADWKRFDSAGRLFWNMNTAADYEEALEIMKAGER